MNKKQEVVKSGMTLGSVLAVVISYVKWKSIGFLYILS